MIDFINGDCMEYMRQMPDKAFDLAIVDPPYGDAMGGGCETIRTDVYALDHRGEYKTERTSQTKNRQAASGADLRNTRDCLKTGIRRGGYHGKLTHDIVNEQAEHGQRSTAKKS